MGERSEFLLEGVVLKGERNDDEASKEEGIDWVSLEKDWDTFVEDDFFPKIACRLVSF